MVTEHERDVAFAERLTATRSTPEVHDLLVEILEDVLGERSTKKAADALTSIVAYSNSQSREWGRKQGDFSARQNVANRLQLGKLVYP